MDGEQESHKATERGTKRKRREPYSRPAVDVSSKFSGKFHTSLKEVQRAAKKAKAQETQKIVKRLKKESSDDKGKNNASNPVNTLEEELKALKILDTDTIMRSALLTRVRKDGVLGKDERIQSALSSFSPVLAPSVRAEEKGLDKVEARIRSSKKVAEVMKECVDSLRKLIVAPTLGDASTKVEGDAEEVQEAGQGDEQDSDSEHPDAGTGEGTDTPILSATGAGTRADDERSTSGFSDAGWESGSIAGDSDIDINDDVGADPQTSSEVERPSKKAKTKKGTKSPHDLPQKPPVQPATIPSASSTFLPSLAVGYTRGDGGSSDDQWDLDDDKGKKNRRGQRARRAIWEKKFGKHANHVKKQREDMSQKYHPRTGGNAQPQRRIATRPPPRFQRNQATQDNSSGSSFTRMPLSRTAAAPPTARVEKPLHPSWAAKQKLQQKQSASFSLGGSGGGSVAARGTKIKFD